MSFIKGFVNLYGYAMGTKVMSILGLFELITYIMVFLLCFYYETKFIIYGVLGF